MLRLDSLSLYVLPGSSALTGLLRELIQLKEYVLIHQVTKHHKDQLQLFQFLKSLSQNIALMARSSNVMRMTLNAITILLFTVFNSMTSAQRMMDKHQNLSFLLMRYRRL